MCYDRKVEDLQFRVEEESITKGDLEVSAIFTTILLKDAVYFLFFNWKISVKKTEKKIDAITELYN